MKISQETINFIKTKIALVMMVKNEEKRIEVSFDSIAPYTDTFIIYDTGSIDSTVSICHDYCKKNNIRLFIKEGTFVDFEESRNVMLKFSDDVLVHSDGSPDQRFLLLFDCNDELKNHEELIDFCKTFLENKEKDKIKQKEFEADPKNKHSSKKYEPKYTQTGFHLKQQWWNGSSYDSYFNVRMILSHSNWTYKQVVHEFISKNYINNKKPKNSDQLDIYKCDNIILFQDRTQDDDKSQRRFKRDKQLLYRSYLKNRNDARLVFYLAQTCGCLQHFNEAYQYYNIRKYQFDGFHEEIYHAYARSAEHALQQNHSLYEILNLNLSAFSHARRCEALLRLAEIYEHKSKHFAFMLCQHACKLMYPHDQILFVDRRAYTFKRWVLLSRFALNIGCWFEGKEAVIKGLQNEPNNQDLLKLLNIFKSLENQKPHMVSKIETSWYKTMKATIKEDVQPIFTDEFEQEALKLMSMDPKKAMKLLPSETINHNHWKNWTNYPEMLEIQTYFDNDYPWEYIQGRYIDLYIKEQTAEPLVKLADYYMNTNFRGENKPDYTLAYLFASHACQIKTPDQCTEQQDYIYNYKRWNLLANSAFFNDQYVECKNAVCKCLQYKKNKEDMNLLVGYIRRENDVSQSIKNSQQVGLTYSLLPIQSKHGNIIPDIEKESIQQSIVVSREHVLNIL